MQRKYNRFIKWFTIIFISITLLLEEVVFREFLVVLATPSKWSLWGQQLDDKNTIMGARKLLEEGDAWNPLTNSNHTTIKSRRLPTCIIIGARKCGTRALLEFLNVHHQIVANLDEMHFFSNDTNYMKGVDWYRSHMPLSRPDQITIEKTPKYFISRIAPARVHRMNSRMKLIVILRHPTIRVISDFTQIYTHHRIRNEAMKSFDLTAINNRTGVVNLDYKALQISVYHQHISRWLDLFPISQLHVVDGENLIKYPILELSKVETFLGLKHSISEKEFYYNTTRGFYCMRQRHSKPERCLGASKGRKHVHISDWVKKKLNDFFRPHNEVLYKLIRRRFRWR